MFYDGPTPPPGVFDDILAVPSIFADIGPRSILSLVQANASNTTGPLTRYIFFFVPSPKLTNKVRSGLGDSIPMSKATAPIFNAVINETVVSTFIRDGAPLTSLIT